MSGYGYEWSDELAAEAEAARTAPLKVGEVVYAEVYDAHAGHYLSVPSTVKGRWRVYAADRYPWQVAVELSCDAGEGFGYQAGDVTSVMPNLVSRTLSDSVMPTGSELSEEHTVDLPEVKIREYRLVE